MNDLASLVLRHASWEVSASRVHADVRALRFVAGAWIADCCAGSLVVLAVASMWQAILPSEPTLRCQCVRRQRRRRHGLAVRGILRLMLGARLQGRDELLQLVARQTDLELLVCIGSEVVDRRE